LLKQFKKILNFLFLNNLAAEIIPDELIEQLAPGGRLVMIFQIYIS